jgi:two-component system sensor kinase FixL
MERGRESEIKLKAIFDAAVDGIITINQKGIIEEVNRAACKLFGYSKEDIIGKNVNILMPFQHSRHHDQYMERYQQTKEARIIGIGREVEGKKKDGELFPFWLAVIEIDLEERKIYTGFIHDLSEIKNAEKQLRAMNEILENKVIERTNELEGAVNQLLSLNKKLEAEINDKIKAQNLLQIREIELEKSLAKERELGELKSRFVSMASHEFRTPLATILSSVSLIGRYSDKDQQQQREKHITKIKSSVTHLTGILNDFLSLNKLEEGKINTSQEIFNPMVLCEEVLDELKPIYKPHQIISIDKGKENDIDNDKVKSDRKILKNIMINLISNAIKYTHDDGVIVCNLEVSRDYVIFKVKDNGIGIPDEDQKHLCDRFFRASNAVNIEGTGLGLNIVKKYAEILEGMITFESKMYIGSTFTVKIKNNYQKPIE